MAAPKALGLAKSGLVTFVLLCPWWIIACRCAVPVPSTHSWTSVDRLCRSCFRRQSCLNASTSTTSTASVQPAATPTTTLVDGPPVAAPEPCVWLDVLGLGVGPTVGETVRVLAVGFPVGEEVGDAVEVEVVGDDVGLVDGVGERVGVDAVGEPDRDTVGLRDVAVGLIVGLAVGRPVGKAVGFAVGSKVGLAVRLAVGLAHWHLGQPSPHVYVYR